MKRAAAGFGAAAAILSVILGLSVWAVTITAAAPAANTSALSDCFGHQGVQFSNKDAYICETKLGDDPSGGLYFMTTLGNNAGQNVLWYKLHPAAGNFWVYETLTPLQDPAEPRDYGRTVQIDEGSAGQCLVNFPSWTTPPTECAYITAGGTVGPEHPFTAAEQASMAEFIKNMQAAVPLADR